MKKVKKRSFSSFTLAEAYKEVGVKKLQAWDLEFGVVTVTDFFAERLRRLTVFDLRGTKIAKELVIDAFLEEALQNHRSLKAWKEFALEGKTVAGVADYLLTEDRDYFDKPFLCVVEAKKDDFEQGLAQCLVEMKACLEANAEDGKCIDIFGVVSNGITWRFYKLNHEGIGFESVPFVISDQKSVIGALDFIFAECEKHI